ncbi:unannotated protein [freshwater metagenome]|uniref:Unannotated protein n=1 Tax=freshwater metagenome TaxID=449393 RepID=A0A6J6L292_9ZZZZ
MYIFKLPIMWNKTKPIIAMPEMAITYFLPTAVEYRSIKNGRLRRARVAVPVTGARPRPVVVEV